ncbi:MAG: hypothetical protein ACMUJM_20250 [bacterium]
MARQFKVISTTNKEGENTRKIITSEEKLRHLQNVTGSIIQDAHDTWAEIWNELKGSVTDGVMILPEAERGHFKPRCGWCEFLEKIWLLKHYLDCAKKICVEKG